ncbi:MAG: PAS domain S-box protein [Candidatus Desulforudis sp.]|nr:PAS domain S-box protein [Desulforudis sp.]
MSYNHSRSPGELRKEAVHRRAGREPQTVNCERAVILESITDAFFALDEQWRCTYVNDAAAQILLKPRRELVGKHIWDLHPSFVGTELYHELRKAMVLKVSAHLEVRSDYTGYWYEYHVYSSPQGLAVFFRDITERKRAEKALRLSEERFGTAFHASPNPTCIATMDDGRIVDVNRVWTSLLGYDRDEVIGKTISELGILPGPEERRLVAERLLENTQPSELVVRTKSGQERIWLVSAAQVVLDGHDCILSQSLDVTKKRKTEEALKISEHRLSLIHDMANDLLFLVRVEPDEVYRVVTVSNSYLKTMGMKREEVIGKTPQQVLPEEHARYVTGKYREALSLKRTIRYAEFIETPDGIKICETTLTPVLDDTGNFFYLLGVIHDITEQERTAEALRLSEERFSKAFNCSPVLMTITRAEDGRFVDVNAAFSRVMGCTREETVGRTASELGLDAALENHPHWVEILAEQREVQAQEVKFKTWPGAERTGLVSTEIIDIGGEECLLNVIQDITEQRHLEREMVRLDRLDLIGEMAAGIAHEIRNPMTSARGFIQLLGEKEERPQHRCYFDLVIQELDRANAIISEYLSLAKNKTVDKQQLNLNKVIQALMPMIAADARKSDKDVNIQLAEVPDLLLDEKEIRQLILNLVRNGLEAMEAHGILTIRTALDDGAVVLQVEDQGPGIPDEFLNKLGTPFFTTKESGTGLGLAVCHSIAHRHNATVAPETGPNGTTFHVRFNIPPPD